MGGDLFLLHLFQYLSINFNPRLHYGRRHGRIQTGSYDKDDFNPRLHYGRRHNRMLERAPKDIFQSTPPLWEATFIISIGSPSIRNFNPRLHYGRRLSYIYIVATFYKYFNPRLHYGRRLKLPIGQHSIKIISIHASTMGGDAYYRG